MDTKCSGYPADDIVRAVQEATGRLVNRLGKPVLLVILESFNGKLGPITCLCRPVGPLTAESDGLQKIADEIRTTTAQERAAEGPQQLTIQEEALVVHAPNLILKGN